MLYLAYELQSYLLSPFRLAASRMRPRVSSINCLLGGVPSFSRRLRMAAPFWRSLPGNRPIGSRAAVVTVCVIVMRPNLEVSSELRNRKLDTDGH